MPGEGTLGHECPLDHGTWVAFDFSPTDMEAGWSGLGFTLQDPGAKSDFAVTAHSEP